MAGKDKKAENFLDLIPSHGDQFKWQRDEEGNVVIFVENTGLFNRFFQKFFKKPEVSKVHLEGFGSFIWPLIDGKLSVYDIAKLIKQEFGQEAEPLYERLILYMRSLENCGFVHYVQSDSL